MLYQQENILIKEPEIILFISSCLEKFQGNMLSLFLQMVPVILRETLPMITQDFTSFPEHREYFFLLIQSMAKNCFEVFLNLESQQFQTIIDCVIWAMKHDEPKIQNIGLETLLAVMKNINNQAQFSHQFFQYYYSNFLEELMYIMSDGLHQNSFHLISQVL
jgi:exportin-1